MSRCKLEEFISYEQPAKYIVDSDQYDDSYEIPVLTAGKSFILGYTDEKNNIFDNLPVIIFDDFTTSVQFVDFQFKVKSSAMKLLKNTEQADIKYCYYLLKFLQHTPENHKRQWLSATSQNTVELPAIEEQKNIVKKLDKILEVIDNQNKQMELLDEAIKARFVEMFGEIEDCDRWKSKIWNEVVTIQNGRDYKKVLVNDGGYPVVGTGGEIARASGYLCPENTIVVGRKGSINNPMLMKEKFWNVDTAFGVIPNSDYLHYQYFYYFCKFYNFMKLNKATTLPSTTKADLLKIRINIPPLELQNQFASFVQEIDKSRSRIQKSLEASQELFDSLMQEYFG